MLGVIKEQLLKIVEDIDAGNTNADEEELLSIAKALKKYTRKDVLDCYNSNVRCQCPECNKKHIFDGIKGDFANGK